jgi:hypothetical protein
MTHRVCAARKPRSFMRVMRLRKSRCPALSAPCSWNTCFAMSKPIHGSLLHGRLLRWQFDTVTLAHKCRQGASTPSPIANCPASVPHCVVLTSSQWRSLAKRLAGENSAAISSSRLDFRERPFYSFAILLPLLIGQRLRFGARQRVKDAQPHQRHDIVENVGRPPEQAPQPLRDRLTDAQQYV